MQKGGNLILSTLESEDCRELSRYVALLVQKLALISG